MVQEQKGVFLPNIIVFLSGNDFALLLDQYVDLHKDIALLIL